MIDARNFYNESLKLHSFTEWFEHFTIGTNFITCIIAPFSILHIGFGGIAILFTMSSFLGYYYLIQDYWDRIRYNDLIIRVLFILYLFLPSIHFWTTTISKEALVFPLLLYFFRVFNNGVALTLIHKYFVLITFLILILIRPYIGVILLLSICSYLVLARKFKFSNPLIISILGSIFLNIVFFWQFNVKEYSLYRIKQRYNNLDIYSKNNGVAIIDLNKTNYFERFVDMMYKPNIFNVKNSYQFFYSLENLVLLIFTCFIIIYCTIRKINIINLKFIFGMLMWLFISIYIYNYGLASRMKIMMVPFILLGIIENILKYHEKKTKTC